MQNTRARWQRLLQSNATQARKITQAVSCGVEPKPGERLKFNGAHALQLAGSLKVDALEAALALGMHRLAQLQTLSEQPNASEQTRRDYATALHFMSENAPQLVQDTLQNGTPQKTAIPSSTKLLDIKVLEKINPGWQTSSDRRVNCRNCVLAYDEWARTGNLVQAQPSNNADASMLPITRKYGKQFERMPALRLLISKMERAGDGALGIVKLDIGDDFTHYLNIVNVKGKVYLIDPQLDPSTQPPMPVSSEQAGNDPTILRRFLTPQIKNWALARAGGLVVSWNARVEMGEDAQVDQSIANMVDLSLIRTRAATGGLQAIGRLSQTAPVTEVPGEPGGPTKAVDPVTGTHPLFTNNGGLRYVRTAELTPKALGYTPELRPRLDDPYTAFDKSLSQFPRIHVKETQTLLVSDLASGSSAVVKVGDFNGRVVAMRWLPQRAGESNQQYKNEQLQSARGSQFLSDLGIGPTFHGLYTNARGETYEVTDIVPGDHYDAVGEGHVNHLITQRTFDDLEEMMHRLEVEGLEDLESADMQYLLMPNGKLLAIDGGNVVDALGNVMTVSPNARDGSFTTERISFLQYASEAVGAQYMEELRQHNPESWAALVLKLNAVLNGSRPLLGLERHLDYVQSWVGTAQRGLN